MSELQKDIWPCLVYEDAPAAVEFLNALGFTSTLTVPGDAAGKLDHAQLRWPEGGGVMLSTASREGGDFAKVPVGSGSTYVVTDDPHAVLAKAEAIGARVVREMRDEDYGSTGFTIADGEGNLWSFGTYRGEPG